MESNAWGVLRLRIFAFPAHDPYAFITRVDIYRMSQNGGKTYFHTIERIFVILRLIDLEVFFVFYELLILRAKCPSVRHPIADGFRY